MPVLELKAFDSRLFVWIVAGCLLLIPLELIVNSYLWGLKFSYICLFLTNSLYIQLSLHFCDNLISKENNGLSIFKVLNWLLLILCFIICGIGILDDSYASYGDCLLSIIRITSLATTHFALNQSLLSNTWIKYSLTDGLTIASIFKYIARIVLISGKVTIRFAFLILLLLILNAFNSHDLLSIFHFGSVHEVWFPLCMQCFVHLLFCNLCVTLFEYVVTYPMNIVKMIEQHHSVDKDKKDSDIYVRKLLYILSDYFPMMNIQSDLINKIFNHNRTHINLIAPSAVYRADASSASNDSTVISDKPYVNSSCLYVSTSNTVEQHTLALQSLYIDSWIQYVNTATNTVIKSSQKGDGNTQLFPYMLHYHRYHCNNPLVLFHHSLYVYLHELLSASSTNVNNRSKEVCAVVTALYRPDAFVPLIFSLLTQVSMFEFHVCVIY